MKIKSLSAKTIIRCLAISSGFLLASGCATSSSSEKEAASIGDSHCGEISVFFKPPSTMRHFSASIFNIDGNNVNTQKKSFKLKPGKHSISMFNHSGDLLKASGLSSPRYLSQKASVSDVSNYSLPPISRSKSNSTRLYGGKQFDFEVKKNITYHLTAEYIPENKHKKKTRAFWKPVVWKVDEKVCSLDS